MLQDVWLECIAAPLTLDGAHNDKLLMPRTKGRFVLTGKYCKQQCGHNNFHTVIVNRCPRFFMITAVEEQASVFVCQCSPLYVFYNTVEKRASERTFQMKRVTISAFSVCIELGHL